MELKPLSTQFDIEALSSAKNLNLFHRNHISLPRIPHNNHSFQFTESRWCCAAAIQQTDPTSPKQSNYITFFIRLDRYRTAPPCSNASIPPLLRVFTRRQSTTTTRGWEFRRPLLLSCHTTSSSQGSYNIPAASGDFSVMMSAAFESVRTWAPTKKKCMVRCADVVLNWFAHCLLNFRKLWCFFAFACCSWVP